MTRAIPSGFRQLSKISTFGMAFGFASGSIMIGEWYSRERRCFQSAPSESSTHAADFEGRVSGCAGSVI